jgi:hypothetical protein
MEATESPSTVLGFYDELLRANPANAVRIPLFFVLHPELIVN